MNSKLPKRFYRYQKFNALSLDALCNDQLYFSDPAEFNDPLDCKPSIELDSDSKTLRLILTTLIERRVEVEMLFSLKAAKFKGDGAIAHAKKQSQQVAKYELNNIAYHATNPDYTISVDDAECQLLKYAIQTELLKQKNLGVCCLSTQYDNPLLWSHYGDQHNGFCVGYSLNRKPKPIIHNVLYGGSRTIKTSLIEQAIVNDDADAKNKLDQNILLRKALPWKYEKEWRILDRVGLQDSPLFMEEIIFGLRCSYSVMHSVMAALKPRDIKFYCMHIMDGSFKIRRTDDIYEFCHHLPRTSISGVEAFGSIDSE